MRCAIICKIWDHISILEKVGNNKGGMGEEMQNSILRAFRSPIVQLAHSYFLVLLVATHIKLHKNLPDVVVSMEG